MSFVFNVLSLHKLRSCSIARSVLLSGRTSTRVAAVMPKRKRTASKVIVPAVEVKGEAAASILPAKTAADGIPTRRSLRTKKTVVVEEAAWDYPEQEDDPSTDSLDGNEKSSKKSPGKQKRRKKNDEPVVYDILPVERKYTSFKGRLGYACLNTILRAQKPESIFCSRTCRKDTIHKNGLDFAKNLGLQNCRDLYKLIEWNEENNIRFLRVSSEMFPFASHAELGYDLEYAKAELKAAGDLAKRLGHRLTTHPGQFTQLASPKENVVEASVRELDYHCQMMRYMGMGKDSVIIIHMGGMYGDKPSALERFKENYTTKLTEEMKARLVLENDEMCYNADELLPICNELGIPIVLDYHHNWIYPSVHPLSTLIPMINVTWLRKGIKPKQHLSSPRPGCEDGSVMEKRGHADRCYSLPDELVLPPSGDEKESVEVDLMIEAKDKEQAVFLLHRIYDLMPVKHENLRPEKAPKLLHADDSLEAAESGETAARTTKKTRGRDKTGTGTEVIISTPKKRRASKKNPEIEPCTGLALIDQDDLPVPVDGAKIETIEADEHPEAVAAAHVDGDGCGAPPKKQRTKRK